MRMASVTTLAADLGNTMVFPSLLFGGELHLLPVEVSRDPQRFMGYIQEHDIHALKVVPTHLRVLLDQGVGVLPSRLLVVGGEPFGLDLLARLEACRPACAVFNHYGPTEATVGVAMCPVNAEPGSAERLRTRGHRTVPIGTPLGETELRIVDEQLNPCVAGQVGELLVSGPSVSDGYLGSSGLGFIEADWSPYRHAYRTGDLALVHATGEFELFGRVDRQFKIRGHRVEAAGIEEALRDHPGVVDAFVDLREQGDLGAVLVAWVHADGDLDDLVLRGFLADRLPRPMIPSRIVVMNSLPRTANGKVDTRALPDLHKALSADVPRSAEDAAAHVFARVLALPLEAAHDNFFRLGGHSLAALQAICRLREDYGLEVAVEDFYADASPAGMARAARPVKHPAPPVAPDQVVPQVSPQAEALWTHLQLNPHDAAYEVPVRLRVRGAVTPERVHLALAALVARHEALRTRYEVLEGRLVASVVDGVSETLTLADDWPSGEQHTGRLDVGNGPLIRGAVTAIGSNECLVNLLIHHIIYDGVSATVLVRELAAMLADEPLLPVQEVRAEARVSRGRELAALGDGARARFGLPPPQLLGRGPTRCHELRLHEALWAQVDACATRLNTTPFAVAAAAWALVLSRQDNEPAVTLGTPVDLRDPSLEDRLVGYHTNVVVLEVELSPYDTVRELIGRTHKAVGRALEGRHRPYAALVAAQRAATGTPPTRTLLTIERLERTRCADVEIRQEAVVQPRPVFDLDVCVVLADQTATLQIHHRVDVCQEGRARCLIDQFSHVLAQFVADPGVKSGDVSILPFEWGERVLEWSRGLAAVPPGEWGVRAFSRQVVADPDALALAWPEGEWSRSQFAQAITQTSRTLRDRGLGPGHSVAIAVPPSPALAVSWHAAYQVGAAVLALDPVWPQSRLDAASRLARADVRITSPDGMSVNVAGSAPAVAPHASDLAYLILTSGSTGAPKLVAVQHSALANELSWFAATFPLDRHDRVLAHSSPGFDVAVWDMLGPLSWGASLIFPAVGRRNDVSHLAELVRDKSITVLQAVPSLLEALLAEFAPGPLQLRLLVSGGEEMPLSLPSEVAQRLPGTTLVNTYGPSETAIDVIFYRVEGALLPSGRVPLGRPIAGTRAYVLDERYRLLPPGAFGQLAIAGKAVGRGYLEDSAGTARRFVGDPFAPRPGSRMYLTGDRARWNDEGLLEFGGRQDHQVKVRGNRVELEEVEAALRSLPLVHDAVVHLQSGGSMRARLVAFVVPSEDGGLTVHDLHNRCAQLLPSYMAPSVFVLVASLPRLSNGKVARHALPLEALDSAAPAGNWHTEMETLVGRVWSDVLGHQALERDLPFFACGGTSLLIPVLHLRLKESLGVTLSAPELFEHTTIWAQATALEQKVAGVEAETSVAAGRGRLRRQAYEARRRRGV
jgi:amino acid adenylation domain-containing protein